MQYTIFTHTRTAPADFSCYLNDDDTLTQEGVDAFQQYILAYYREHGREFSWRTHITPYRILVSEIMLQQTQAKRVAKKFEPFIAAFPTCKDLANSSFQEVLTYWHGLGYNRRARGLHNSAYKVVHEYNGVLPEDPDTLQTFPSIGPNTAASIATFAYNRPTVFFETNIRTVFIYHFFQRDTQISDARLYPIVEQTLYRSHPRIWYFALMDYGVHLKNIHGNFNRQSKHYTTQSRFEGSERQIRGMILRVLTHHGPLSFDQLCRTIPRESHRVYNNAQTLIKDGLIQESSGTYQLVA